MAEHERAASGLIWSQPFAIELGWLDGNGHLNMAYYHVMFDRTVDLGLAALGLCSGYRSTANAAVFTVETHIVYLREVMAADWVRCAFQLLGADDKRLHVVQRMVHDVGLPDAAEDVAVSESMLVHVDLSTRRAAPFPERKATRIVEMARAHAHVPAPRHAGRRIAPLTANPRTVPP